NRSAGPAQTATGMLMPPVPWGKAHHEEFQARFGKSNVLCVISEDLPEEHNRIDLDPELKDSHGIPAPRAFYKISQNTRKLLDHGIANAVKVMEAAGAHRTFALPWFR